MKDKAIIAMSGGVDSSVAAALLIEQGYDVTGVFMCLGAAGRDERDAEQAESKGCCSPQDAADARRVADVLGIDLFVLNMAEAFEEIIDNFVSQYAAGRTPNPCILCNSRIKFGHLLQRADSLGARYVATGHHARIVRDRGTAVIARAQNLSKDQSYALFAVSAQVSERMILPIGEIDDKSRVRELALSLGLNVHDKPDSQEVCFVPDDDYARLLRTRAPAAMTPGDIVDCDGKVLGTHSGYAQFTIGQRRGLGVAASEPLYVTAIDPATAQVTIGPRAQTLSTHLSTSQANWHRPVADEFNATVQIRYNHRGAAARVRMTGKDHREDAFEVQFAEPVSAITPGQAAVVYDGDLLLGGGWID